MSTLVVAALALASAAMMPATAQGNSGTIKVHDGPSAEPDRRNEPHVTGDAFVEGFNMAEDGGDLLFYSWPPTGDMELVLATTWTADDGEPEFHFLAGPFFLPCGHYRVFAYNGDGPDDPSEPQPGGAKKKTFWVECEEEPGTEPAPELVCPDDLEATENADASVRLTWTPAPGSDGTNIYRGDNGADFEYLATVGPGVGEYLDTTTDAGSTYTYLVTGLFGDEESDGCGEVEAIAVPVFQGVAGLGLATLLGAGAYLALSRRRKA